MKAVRFKLAPSKNSPSNPYIQDPFLPKKSLKNLSLYFPFTQPSDFPVSLPIEPPERRRRL